MVQVMTHTDSLGIKTHGIWWVDPLTGYPVGKYTRPGSPEEARGRAIVLSKENVKVSWPEWFAQLTTRAPYSESWRVFDSSGLTPEEVLLSL